MYSKVNYMLIGIFVLVFSIGIVLFAFWLGNSGFKEDYDLYVLRMRESVSGLSVDSGVKMKGVDVGSVSEIGINPNNIEEVDVVLKIRRDAPIKEDMYGVLRVYGLTGLSYIEIEGGTNNSKNLSAPKGEMPVIPSKPSLMVRLEDNVIVLSKKLVDVLDKAERLLSDQNMEHFSGILDNADKLTAKGIDVEHKVIETLGEANVTLSEFRVSFAKLSKDLDSLAVDLRQDAKPSLQNFNAMSKSIDQLAIKIEKTVNRGDYNMQKIMQPTINDIKDLSVQISELTTQLKRSPSDLLFKSDKPRRGPGE